MSTTTPTYTETTIIAAAALARGSQLSGTIDLSAKIGGWLFMRAARSSNKALSSGVTAFARRTIASGADGHPSPLANTSFKGLKGAAVQTTVNVDSSSGQRVLNVGSTVQFKAGQVISICDGDGSGVSRLEFHRIMELTNTTLILDRNLRYSHTLSEADFVTNQADVFDPVFLAGGCIWEVVLDYSNDRSGDKMFGHAVIQTHANDVTA
jgi:hypothetical protein